MPEVSSDNLELIKIPEMMALAKMSAQDLSMLNGVSEKINSSYLKTLQQIMVFTAAEKVRNGATKIRVTIPYIGEIIITRILARHKHTKKIIEKLEYKFVATQILDRKLRKAFETGECELPTNLAAKYGDKLTAMYERYLTE